MLAQRLCNLQRGVTRSQKHWENIPWGPRVCAAAFFFPSSCPPPAPPAALLPPLSSPSRTHAQVRLRCTDSADFVSNGCKETKNVILGGKRRRTASTRWGEAPRCSPWMISSFTLCNSRTTSSKISCVERRKHIKLEKLQTLDQVDQVKIKTWKPVSSCRILCRLHWCCQSASLWNQKLHFRQ